MRRLLVLILLAGCSAAQSLPMPSAAEVKAGLCAYKAAQVYNLAKLTPEQGVQLALDLAACAPRETPAGDSGA